MEDMPELSETGAHTLDINQVQCSKVPERGSGRGSFHNDNNYLNDKGHHVDVDNIMAENDVNSNTLLNSELLHMVRKQEMAWGSAEAAVGKLERRLRMLERSESMKKTPIHVIQDNPAGLGQVPCEHNFAAGHYSCIYVSPIYDDKKGSIMYRTHIVEDGGYGLRSRSFNDRGRHDEKDLEIKKLKSELQRRDLEIRRLKTDLQRLRSLEFEEERNTVSDKFVDKVNTIRMPTIIPRNQSYHDTMQFSRADLNNSFTSCGISAENSNGFANRLEDSQNFQGSHCGTPGRNLGPNGLMKAMKDKIVAGRRGNSMGPSAVPDLDRSVLSLDCSKSGFMVQQIVRSFLSTMQISVENLCNSIRMREPRDSDVSKIDSGAIEDELFILKKTLSKLEETCQQSDYQSFADTGNDQLDVGKMENFQNTIDGMMQQLAQTEFKVIGLESSCIEKDRKVEDLESRIHAILKETEAVMMEKYELTTVVREMYKEAEEQRHRMEELLSINEELLEFSQAKEEKLGSLQEAKDRLMQQVVRYEDNCVMFESLLQEKDKEVEDLNRRLKAGQIGADAIIFEKFELTAKVQAMQKEVDEQKRRIDDLVSINEELLEFAQSKEDQLVVMKEEVAQLREQPGGSLEKNYTLVEENRDKKGAEVEVQEETRI